MMRTMTSSVGTNPAPLTRQISDLKQRQDNATARMGSDSVALLGTPDPDFYGFVTDTFKTMKPVTVLSGNGVYSTIAILPDQQHATLEDRYYKAGTPFVMDRAGSASVGLNILRGGPPPAGYYGGNKLMVQVRDKRHFAPDTGSDADFTFRWEVADVKTTPKDYTLQPDEQLDGSFYPGSIYRGLNPAFGWTFPTGGTGGMLYNPNPFGPSAWSGAVNTVPNNPATKPVINSITPDTYEIGSDASFTVSGSNFTGAGFVMVGPFLPNGIGVEPDLDFDPYLPDGIYVIPPDIPGDTTFYSIPPGASSYRHIQDDNTIYFNPPTSANPQPGTFDIIVVGADGQIGRLENGLTITEAGS